MELCRGTDLGYMSRSSESCLSALCRGRHPQEAWRRGCITGALLVDVAAAFPRRGAGRGRVGRSRLKSKEVGAACTWQTHSGWTGHRFCLGSNKEVFDAEIYAIYQALHILDQSGHRYTVFVDSTAAID